MPKVNWAADSPMKHSRRFIARDEDPDESSLQKAQRSSHCLDPPLPLTHPDPKNDQDILRSVIQAVQRTSSFSMGACSAPTSHPPLPVPSNLSLRPPSSHNQHLNHSAPPPLLSQELNSSRVWGTQEHKQLAQDPLQDDGADKENCNGVRQNHTPMTTGRKKRRHDLKEVGPSSDLPRVSTNVNLSLIDVDKGLAVEDEGLRDGKELTDLLNRVAQAADHSLYSDHEEESQAEALAPHPLPPPPPAPSAAVNVVSSWDAAGDAFDAFFDDVDDEALDQALACANEKVKNQPQPQPSAIRLAFGRDETHYLVKSVEPGDRLVLHSEFSVRCSSSFSVHLTPLTLLCLSET